VIIDNLYSISPCSDAVRGRIGLRSVWRPLPPDVRQLRPKKTRALPAPHVQRGLLLSQGHRHGRWDVNGGHELQNNKTNLLYLEHWNYKSKKNIKLKKWCIAIDPKLIQTCLCYVNTLLYCSRKMHSRLDVSVLRRRRQRVPAWQYHREGLSDMVGRMYHVLVCQ